MAAQRKILRWKESFELLDFVGNGSLLIIVFCVCFAAMVTILESSFHMKLVIQNDSMVPGFASMLILRELAVVVTALLLTSRIGAGIAAEIGTMKITEQIDALKMLGIEPLYYLVIPRLLACVFGTLFLTVVANMACLASAVFISDIYLGYSPAIFFEAMHRFVHFHDIILAMIKGAVFGLVIPVVSCYYGFHCEAGAEGVGRATTNSVVVCSIAIIVLDFVLSYAFSSFY